MSKTSEYRIWKLMRTRCTSAHSKAYGWYGGRGIRVCVEWDSSFERFFADMGPRPSLAHSIDRIDVNGNYEPGNCRWATKWQQAQNRRSNRILEAFGRRQVLAEWSRELGTDQSVIADRLRRGWSVERAVSEPLSARGFSGYRVDNGEILSRASAGQSVADIASAMGISDATVRLVAHSPARDDPRHHKRDSDQIGVTMDRQRGRWRARVRYRGRLVSVGTFVDEVAAITALARAQELIASGQFEALAVRRIGPLHPVAKLTAEDVRNIRVRLGRGETQQSIADDYGVTQTLISRIVRGLTWVGVGIDTDRGAA